MMRITNGGAGPRGVHTLAGLVYLDPGQTIDAEVSAAEAPGILAHPDLVVEEPEAPAKSARKPKV